MDHDNCWRKYTSLDLIADNEHKNVTFVLTKCVDDATSTNRDEIS